MIRNEGNEQKTAFLLEMQPVIIGTGSSATCNDPLFVAGWENEMEPRVCTRRLSIRVRAAAAREPFVDENDVSAEHVELVRE